MAPLPFTMNSSDQIVDIAGNTAVIHGINTLVQGGPAGDRVMGVERFTDVFELRDGHWIAHRRRRPPPDPSSITHCSKFADSIVLPA